MDRGNGEEIWGGRKMWGEGEREGRKRMMTGLERRNWKEWWGTEGGGEGKRKEEGEVGAGGQKGEGEGERKGWMKGEQEDG